MKKLLNKKNICLIVFILLIIAGIIVLSINGFEKSQNLKAGTRIEIYIPQGYEKQEIINIAKEIFNEKYFGFEEIEKLNQIAGIKVKDCSEEEMKNLESKIMEKYEIDENDLEIYQTQVPSARISTLVEPYIFPLVLTTLLALIYIIFRNLKNENKLRILLRTMIILTITLGTYFSLILIFRLPFGNYTMPLALAIYIITLIVIVNNKK